LEANPSSWQAALREAVRDVAELGRLLELPVEEIERVAQADVSFPLLVPRSFVARMRKRDLSDPLLKQVLPLAVEQVEAPGYGADPLREQAIAVNGVLRKYAGRALLIATGACPVHCRYCFRRAFPYSSQLAARADWSLALAELSTASGIEEVILSGGDPLSLTNRRLEALLDGLAAIGTVRRVRIHTRFPIMLPERVDSKLARLLEATPLQTVVVVHANHAREIDVTVAEALLELRKHVDMLLNQSVLLRGVNDDAATLTELSERLFAGGVLPYYLHLLDPVAGAAHFEVDEAAARALMIELRARLPGYLVPRLVRETPGELSKTPIL
jgi:EF-P beta-lysylation protein EpmB